MSLADLRREYALASLDVTGVAADPIAQLGQWLDDARAAGLVEPNAMTLATATATGVPSARVVLLKGLDARGLLFFTDYRSRKAAELVANPHAAVVLDWHEIERQVRVEGTVERASDEESAAYFRSRPRGARLGAWASHQSAVLRDRNALESEVQRLAAQYTTDDIPRPPHWGGFRLTPVVVEFWQGRPNRLHDRIRYRREGEGWVIERLSP